MMLNSKSTTIFAIVLVLFLIVELSQAEPNPGYKGKKKSRGRCYPEYYYVTQYYTEYQDVSIIWRPPSLSELTPMIFNTG